MKPSKVLIDSPQSQANVQFSLPTKLLDSSPNSNSHLPTNLFYEPTSVLDPHLTSSPAAAATAATDGSGSDVPPLPWDPHHQHHLLLPPPASPPPSDDWDPVAWFPSEKDDLSTFTKLPHHPQFHFSEEDDLSYASLFDGPLDLPDPFDPLPPFIGFSPPPAFDRTHLELLLR